MKASTADMQSLLRQEQELNQKLHMVKSAIHTVQRNCSHNWWEEKYTPVFVKGYTIPEYHSGVHHDAGYTVPDETKPAWTRTCKKCNLSQTTSTTTEEVKKTVKPNWK